MELLSHGPLIYQAAWGHRTLTSTPAHAHDSQGSLLAMAPLSCLPHALASCDWAWPLGTATEEVTPGSARPPRILPLTP